MYSSEAATFSRRSPMWRRAATLASSSSSRSRARAWRSVSSNWRSSSTQAGLSRSSRSLLATADWDRPSRRAASSWLMP